MAENVKDMVIPETLRLAFDDYCNGCDVPKLKLDNLEIEDGFCCWHNHYTLYCENREACERMNRRKNL